jgi:hypothetical protein
MIQKKYSILVTNCFYSKINRTAVIEMNNSVTKAIQLQRS